MNPFLQSNSSEESDSLLIERTLHGDKNALNELIKRHQSSIYNIAWKMIGDPIKVEDLTQESLLKIITNLSTFNFNSSFRWAYRIVKNHFLNDQKKPSEKFARDFDELGNRLDAVENIDLTVEEQGINQAVRNAYALISFDEGSTPDYEALKSVFMPQATFYNFAADSLRFQFLDEFVAGFKGAIDAGSLMAFKEVELGGKTEYFGKVGHRMSAYGSYINGSEEILAKGVNSFQVLKVDGKWLVNSIIWDIEKMDQPIPDKFLNKQ